MLKNNIIVFPPKLCQMLPSLLVWPLYKPHPLLVASSWYQKYGLYPSVYIYIYIYACPDMMRIQKTRPHAIGGSLHLEIYFYYTNIGAHIYLALGGIWIWADLSIMTSSNALRRTCLQVDTMCHTAAYS